ncbi:MAG: hypothetical protein HYW26_02830 [Candidatus Aenigmarchaeota archaeon]|nr:hypothetical protein [Candidatus Aenigmarchaeota archaeon]
MQHQRPPEWPKNFIRALSIGGAAATLVIGAAIFADTQRRRPSQEELYVSEFHVSNVDSSWLEGLKATKAYNVEFRGGRYTVVQLIDCAPETYGKDDDQCDNGGIAALFVYDGSGARVKEVKDEVFDGFKWDETGFKTYEGKLFMGAKRMEFSATRWWTNFGVYAFDESGINRVLSETEDTFNFLSPVEIIGQSKAPYPGQRNVPMSDLRYYSQLTSYRWNEGKGVYEKDAEATRQINRAKQNIRLIANQRRTAPERKMQEMEAYLNPFDSEEIKSIIAAAAAFDAGITRPPPSDIIGSPDLKTFFLQRVAYHASNEWRSLEDQQLKEMNISRPQQAAGGGYEFRTGDQYRSFSTQEEAQKEFQNSVSEKKREATQARCSQASSMARGAIGAGGPIETALKLAGGCN